MTGYKTPFLVFVLGCLAAAVTAEEDACDLRLRSDANSFISGIYYRSGEHSDRNVYSNVPAGLLLYYDSQYESWTIAFELGADQIFAFSDSNAVTPDQITTGWTVLAENDEDWIEGAQVEVDCFDESSMGTCVLGVFDDEFEILDGVYFKVPDTQVNGQGVYYDPRDGFYVSWDGEGYWKISSTPEGDAHAQLDGTEDLNDSRGRWRINIFGKWFRSDMYTGHVCYGGGEGCDMDVIGSSDYDGHYSLQGTFQNFGWYFNREKNVAMYNVDGDLWLISSRLGSVSVYAYSESREETPNLITGIWEPESEEDISVKANCLRYHGYCDIEMNDSVDEDLNGKYTFSGSYDGFPYYHSFHYGEGDVDHEIFIFYDTNYGSWTLSGVLGSDIVYGYMDSLAMTPDLEWGGVWYILHPDTNDWVRTDAVVSCYGMVPVPAPAPALPSPRRSPQTSHSSHTENNNEESGDEHTHNGSESDYL